MIMLLPLEQVGAHHGRRGERDHQGDGHGHAEGDGKFAENTAQDAAHQENGNEHGDERSAHGEDGEANLLGPRQGGFQRSHTFFQIAGNVFDYDDGIVDHKSGGDGEGHEGKIVDGIAEQIHDAKGSHQRERHGHAGDGGGPNAVEKSEDH